MHKLRERDESVILKCQLPFTTEEKVGGKASFEGWQWGQVLGVLCWTHFTEMPSEEAK